jgi:hypothetical protein
MRWCVSPGQCRHLFRNGLFHVKYMLTLLAEALVTPFWKKGLCQNVVAYSETELTTGVLQYCVHAMCS